MSLCPFISDVNLDCLVKVLSAGSVCCKGTVFSFVLYPVGEGGGYFDSVEISCCDSNSHTLVFAPTYGFYLT